MRIAVQLVRGSDGHTLWSERFDDRMDDLFDLQDRIAAQVAGQISPNLRTAEISRARARAPGERSAYELALTALPHFWAHRKDENAKALELLDAAVARDPQFSYALALKAWCLAQQPTYLWSENPEDDWEQALRFAERAALDAQDHAPSLTAIGAALLLAGDDVSRSESFIDRAIEIDPNNAWAWMRRGWACCFTKRPDAAIAALEHAEMLSPLDPFRFNVMYGKGAALYHWTDRKAEGLALIEASLAINPGAVWGYRMLATSNYFEDNFEAARAAARNLVQHHPGLTIEYLRRALPTRASATYRPGYFEALHDSGVPLK